MYLWGGGEAKLFRPQVSNYKKMVYWICQNSKTNICSSQDNIKKVKKDKLYVGETISQRLVSEYTKQSTQLKNIHLFVKKNQTI